MAVSFGNCEFLSESLNNVNYSDYLVVHTRNIGTKEARAEGARECTGCANLVRYCIVRVLSVTRTMKTRGD